MHCISLCNSDLPVDISGTVMGESPDCLLLSGTVVSENQDHVCWAIIMVYQRAYDSLEFCVPVMENIIPVSVVWHAITTKHD